MPDTILGQALSYRKDQFPLYSMISGGQFFAATFQANKNIKAPPCSQLEQSFFKLCYFYKKQIVFRFRAVSFLQAAKYQA